MHDSVMTRELSITPMTLGNMRINGVRSLSVRVMRLTAITSPFWT